MQLSRLDHNLKNNNILGRSFELQCEQIYYIVKKYLLISLTKFHLY